jgi:pullulanase/glycogen debranching enzyme
MAERVRVQNLGMSLLAFSQGIPFFHAGVELLRSKSGDRNSYNSGDWFNKLDFTYASNNWGVGLPPFGDNGGNWDLLRPLLANPSLRPGPGDIAGSFTHLMEVLAIRRSTPLLRLRTAADVVARVEFLNTGPTQVPGLIAMVVRDVDVGDDDRDGDDDGDHDAEHDLVVVLVNAAPGPQALAAPALAGRKLSLHPVHLLSPDVIARTAKFDRSTGTFSIPGRTAVVFWSRRAGKMGE